MTFFSTKEGRAILPLGHGQLPEHRRPRER